MADQNLSAGFKMPEGFEEVPLEAGFQMPEGFEEVPLEAKSRGLLPRALSFGKKVATGVADVVLNPSVAISREIQDPSAFTYGAQEGLLLGGAGEGAGATQYILDYLRSKGHDIAPSMINASPSQIGARFMPKDAAQREEYKKTIATTSGEVYDQSRDEQQALIDAARAESPYAFGAGQIAGSLAGFTAPLGKLGALKGETAGKVGAALQGFGAPAITKALATKFAPAGAAALETGFIAAGKQGLVPLAKAVGMEAASAIPMGLAAGALSAGPGESRLEGAGEGALTGSLTSVLAKGVGEGLSAGGSKAAEYFGKKVEDIYTPKKGSEVASFERQKNYEAGRRGENWNSPAFQKGESDEAIAMGMTGSKGSLTNFAEREADKAAETIFQVEKELAQEMGDSLVKATSAGSKFDPNNQLMRNSKLGVTQILDDPTLNISKTIGLRDLKLKLQNNSPITPVEAKTLKDDIYNVIKDFEDDVNPSSKELVSKLTQLAKDVDDSLILQIPSYSATKSRYKTFKEIISDPLISDKKATSLDIGNKEKTKIGYDYFGDDLEGNRLLVKERMHEFITDLSKEGVDRPSQVFFNKIKDNFDDFIQRDKSLNKDSKVVDKLSGLLDKVKDASITNKAKGVVKEPLTPPSTAVGPIATPLAILKGVGDAITNTTSNKVLNKTANLVGRIQGGIEKGKLSPAIQDTLDKLKTLTPNDSTKKSALLNVLLQNHTIRKFLDEQSKESK